MPVITCVVCRCQVTAQVSWTKTCSNPECKAEHKRRKESRRWHERRKGVNLGPRACAHCGGEFKVAPGATKKFCSDQCRIEAKAIARKEKAVQTATSAPLQVDTTWAAIRPAIACQDYDYPVHTNHAAFCPFPGVAA